MNEVLKNKIDSDKRIKIENKNTIKSKYNIE